MGISGKAFGLSDAFWTNMGSRYANTRAKAQAFNRLSTPKKLMYGGGVVGVSSGAYAWHRRHQANQTYSSPGPYYY